MKYVTTKSGIQILLREPNWKDLPELLRYINALSAEDTYLTFSGEYVTQEEEEAYLSLVLNEIEQKNRIHMFAFHHDQLVANADVHRVTRFRKRSLHVGEVAISIAKDYRGQGLGREILNTLIEEARHGGFRLLILDLFSPNEPAFKLYKSVGFQYTGEIPGAVWYKGRYIGQKYMYLPLQNQK